MAPAEFAYIWSTSQTIGHSPFEVVYGLNSTRSLKLTPLFVTKNFSGDTKERAKKIKKLHEQVQNKIGKQNEKYCKQTNKHWKPVVFKEGDLGLDSS